MLADYHHQQNDLLEESAYGIVDARMVGKEVQLLLVFGQQGQCIGQSVDDFLGVGDYIFSSLQGTDVRESM